MSERRYRIGVACIALLALGVRVQNVARNTAHMRLWGDSFDYYSQAQALVEGRGFIAVLRSIRSHTSVPSAEHPPGFTLLLSGLRLLGINSPASQRYALCVLGMGTVLLILLCATDVLGRREGLIAGLIAAIYPNLWINDGVLMSESLFMFGISLALLGLYRYARDTRVIWLVWGSLGLTLALSTRAETILVFPLVIPALIFAKKGQSVRAKLGHIALAACVPLALLVPWYVYNSSRFSEPVYLSTGFGRAVRQGSCGDVFSGRLIGSYSLLCMAQLPPPAVRPGVAPDESVEDSYLRKIALTYMYHHRDKLPRVVLAREGRMWGLWNPPQQDIIDKHFEGRGSTVLTVWARRSYWFLGALAIGGAWVFRRRRIILYPMIAEIAVTAFVAAITFGNTRYRAGVEVCIVILAAAAIDWMLREIDARESRLRWSHRNGRKQ